jgi:hypothetical protein
VALRLGESIVHSPSRGDSAALGFQVWLPASAGSPQS